MAFRVPHDLYQLPCLGELTFILKLTTSTPANTKGSALVFQGPPVRVQLFVTQPTAVKRGCFDLLPRKQPARKIMFMSPDPCTILLDALDTVDCSLPLQLNFPPSFCIFLIFLLPSQRLLLGLHCWFPSSFLALADPVVLGPLFYPCTRAPGDFISSQAFLKSIQTLMTEFSICSSDLSLGPRFEYLIPYLISAQKSTQAQQLKTMTTCLYHPNLQPGPSSSFISLLILVISLDSTIIYWITQTNNLGDFLSRSALTTLVKNVTSIPPLLYFFLPTTTYIIF